MTHSHIICVTTISCYCFHNLWLKVNCVSNFLLTEIFRRGLDAIHESTVHFSGWFPLLNSVIQPPQEDSFRNCSHLIWSFTMQSGELSDNPSSFALSSQVNCEMSNRLPTYPVPGRTFTSNFAHTSWSPICCALFVHCPDSMVNNQSVNNSWKNLLNVLWACFSTWQIICQSVAKIVILNFCTNF